MNPDGPVRSISSPWPPPSEKGRPFLRKNDTRPVARVTTPERYRARSNDTERAREV